MKDEYFLSGTGGEPYDKFYEKSGVKYSKFTFKKQEHSNKANAVYNNLCFQLEALIKTSEDKEKLEHILELVNELYEEAGQDEPEH